MGIDQDPTELVKRDLEILSGYLDAVDMEIFLSTNPGAEEVRSRVIQEQEKQGNRTFSQNRRNPIGLPEEPPRRIVTDQLPEDGRRHKTYRERRL